MIQRRGDAVTGAGFTPDSPILARGLTSVDVRLDASHRQELLLWAKERLSAFLFASPRSASSAMHRPAWTISDAVTPPFRRRREHDGLLYSCTHSDVSAAVWQYCR